jgi:hypothetical protein
MLEPKFLIYNGFLVCQKIERTTLLGSSSIYNAYNLKKKKNHGNPCSKLISSYFSKSFLTRVVESTQVWKLDGLTKMFKLSMVMLFPMQTYSSIALVAML